MSLAVAQLRWATCSPSVFAHDAPVATAEGVAPGVASGPEHTAAISSGPPPLDPPHPATTSATDIAAIDTMSRTLATLTTCKRGESAFSIAVSPPDLAVSALADCAGPPPPW